MKIKKIILIILLGLFLTGCTAEYNINITDDVVSENVSISVDKNNIDEVDSLEYYLDSDITAFNDGDKVYKYKTSEVESGINLKFEYGDLPTYSVSSFFQQCFEKSNISNDDEKIYIKASGFICQSYNYEMVNDVVVNFTTNHEVSIHNADTVNDNVYSWFPLVNNKDITLVLNKKKENSSIENSIEEEPGSNILLEQENQEENSNSIIFVILIIIAFLSIIGLLILYKTKKSQRS